MNVFQFLLHFDQHLATFVHAYGLYAYIVFFVIIFCETGLVITPFLPGDSLLFALGALAARHALNVHFLALILAVAAILGDQTNYSIGRFLGLAVLRRFQGRLIKTAYLEKTEVFFEKYGPSTLILARFVPIIRTFAPFVAGIAQMTYWRFLVFSVLGGVLWIASFTYVGYLFGNIPFVQEHFGWLILFGILS